MQWAHTPPWSTWSTGTAARRWRSRPASADAPWSTAWRSSCTRAHGRSRTGWVHPCRWTSCAGPHVSTFPPDTPHLRPVPSGPDAAAAAQHDDAHAEPWNGITAPRRRHAGPRFLTDVLVELEPVRREDVDEAIEAARARNTTPEQLLVERGQVSHEGLARATAERHGLDHVDLNVFTVDMGAANLLSAAAAKRYEAIPIAFASESALVVAMADPANVLAIDDIALMTGYEVRPVVAAREDVLALVQRVTRLDGVVTTGPAEDHDERPSEVVDLRETADDAPVIKLVNQIVAQAIELGASDIHFEPEEREMRVRFRVDGVLQQ